MTLDGLESFDSKSPVDGRRKPLYPWVTSIPFIDFIKERLKKQHTVFRVRDLATLLIFTLNMQG